MKNTDLDLAASQLSCDADSTEQEAIDLLKSQYEQIQQLKYQNETKDKTIKTLKNQVKMLNEKVKYFEDNFENDGESFDENALLGDGGEWAKNVLGKFKQSK
jgi:hypothetical protein